MFKFSKISIQILEVIAIVLVIVLNMFFANLIHAGVGPGGSCLSDADCTEDACGRDADGDSIPDCECTGSTCQLKSTVPAASTAAERPAGSELTNPIGVTAETPAGTTDIKILIASLVKFLLSVVGAFALVYFIYGGFTWLTSGGNPDRIKKGRDILMWATIGLAAIFASYAILKFFFKMLGV